MKPITLQIGLVGLLLISCKSKVLEPTPPPDYSKIMCAPATTDTELYQSDNIAPLFEGLNVLDWPISTDNELVQKYFNQGMVLAFGFNHAEAARSFYYATKLDPTCAMAYWGYAYVLGPNYNAGMEPDNYQRAYAAIEKAKALVNTNGTDKEIALIDVMAKRYTATPVDDRSDLDLAYSKAWKTVYQSYPDDATIGTLYAESLMNLHPWDLFTAEGEIKEWTPEILSTLNAVIQLDSKHCGAHHFYIHAVEASGDPSQGLSSAAVFDDGLVPGAGHLLHMPSHIYIRTGDYHLGTLSNMRAVESDSLYTTACHAQGAYPLAYYPHNYHFMAATATLEGNSEWALLGADMTAEMVSIELMKEPEWGTLQHYYTIPYYVYVKFGKWDRILEMENNDPTIKYPEAIRHYARGMAFLGKQDLTNAKKELMELNKYADDESLKEVTIWDINSVYTLIQLAELVLQAEILAREGAYAESIALLNEAVTIEDNLNYNEPPDWFFSIRHHLGAVQIEAKQFEEAIITYNEDLIRLPKNGWALHGLKRAYQGLRKVNQLTIVENQLETIWATADIQLEGSMVR